MQINQEKKNHGRMKFITGIILVILLAIGFVGWYLHTHTHTHKNVLIKRDANGVSIERTPTDLKFEQELIQDISKKLKAIKSDRSSVHQPRQANVILTN